MKSERTRIARSKPTLVCERAQGLTETFTVPLLQQH